MRSLSPPIKLRDIISFLLTVIKKHSKFEQYKGVGTQMGTEWVNKKDTM